MMGDEGKGLTYNRPCSKTHASFNNYPKWKQKLRENCLKRVRDDRTRLLWKLRLPDVDNNEPSSSNHEKLVKSTLKDIVSDELRKIKGTSIDEGSVPTFETATDDMIWEYDGLQTAYHGDCEEMLLEMQKIFYEDLRTEDFGKDPESLTKTWEDEEDAYLAHVVYKHMQLNSEQEKMKIWRSKKRVEEVVWCPICKTGELRENGHHIYCSQCQLKLKRDEEVDLNFLRVRLGEAHTEHLDRGCRLRPEFCIETKFDFTALYIKCQGCNTFEVVL